MYLIAATRAEGGLVVVVVVVLIVVAVHKELVVVDKILSDTH